MARSRSERANPGIWRFLHLPAVRFNVEVEAVHPAFHHEMARESVVHRSVTTVERAGYRNVDRLIRNPVVDHIDHATDGVGPIEQRGRSADDLDTLRADWVERDGVVHAGAGGIDGVHAILQDPDPVGIQTANHRPACGGTEVGGTHPGSGGEGFPQGGLGLLLEPFPA